MTLVVCMAHRGVEDTCHRHLPYWINQGEVLFFSPTDSVPRLRDQTIVSYGPRGHHSKHANDRFLAMLNVCAKTCHERIVIHEYDSLSFAPFPDAPMHQLAGIAYDDLRAGRKFVGTVFIHPPLLMHRSVLLQITDTLATQKEDECFMWDRWLGLAVERSKIPVFNLRTSGLGFSRNTITAAELPEAKKAIDAGAICFHGVKSRGVFDALKRHGKW